jgi:hypothetical protein
MASTSAGADIVNEMCSSLPSQNRGCPTPVMRQRATAKAAAHPESLVPGQTSGGCEIRTREGVNPTRSPNPQTMVQTSPQVCVYVCASIAQTPGDGHKRGLLSSRLLGIHSGRRRIWDCRIQVALQRLVGSLKTKSADARRVELNQAAGHPAPLSHIGWHRNGAHQPSHGSTMTPAVASRSF